MPERFRKNIVKHKMVGIPMIQWLVGSFVCSSGRVEEPLESHEMFWLKTCYWGTFIIANSIQNRPKNDVFPYV